jgi:hypothetical protein
MPISHCKVNAINALIPSLYVSVKTISITEIIKINVAIFSTRKGDSSR